MFILYTWEGGGQWILDGFEVTSYSIQWEDENNPRTTMHKCRLPLFTSLWQESILIHQNEGEEIGKISYYFLPDFKYSNTRKKKSVTLKIPDVPTLYKYRQNLI